MQYCSDYSYFSEFLLSFYFDVIWKGPKCIFWWISFCCVLMYLVSSSLIYSFPSFFSLVLYHSLSLFLHYAMSNDCQAGASQDWIVHEFIFCHHISLLSQLSEWFRIRLQNGLRCGSQTWIAKLTSHYFDINVMMIFTES